MEYGAFLLALLAGCVNAVGLLGFQHQAITHISGTVTQLGNSLLTGIDSSIHLLFIIFSFLIGAAFSGFFIESSALKLGRRYGVALCIEGSLLLLSWGFLVQGNVYGQYLASAACGLQNAMITTFSGAVVRTTHMTGIITDLGIMIGESLRGRQFDRRKALLLLFIFIGFLLGGIAGAALFTVYGLHTLIFPALLAFGIALIYGVYLLYDQEQTPR